MVCNAIQIHVRVSFCLTFMRYYLLSIFCMSVIIVCTFLTCAAFRAVEDELLDALVVANSISAEDATDPARRLHFQRCARTDKSVSALGQCCSLRLRIVPYGTQPQTQAETQPEAGSSSQAPASFQQQPHDTPPTASAAADASDSPSSRSDLPDASEPAAPPETTGPKESSAPKSGTVHAVGKGGRTDPNAADCARLVDRINEQLPDQIRVIGPSLLIVG